VTIANPWEDFHVYAMEWYADRIDIFVDGQKYFTFRNEGTGSGTRPFDKPQYLLINLAIGGSWTDRRASATRSFLIATWWTTCASTSSADTCRRG
jgi:beta-glucanase (GH16 family)